MLRNLCSLISQTVSSWWTVDRIRTPPAEGRLLELREGQSVLIRDRPFRVETRHESCGTTKLCVQYRLSSESQSALLTVAQEGSRRITGVMETDGQKQTVFNEDMVLLPCTAEV